MNCAYASAGDHKIVMYHAVVQYTTILQYMDQVVILTSSYKAEDQSSIDQHKLF